MNDPLRPADGRVRPFPVNDASPFAGAAPNESDNQP